MTPTGFIEAPRFPDCISEGSTGGPTYRTDVNATDSGHEHRNAKWAVGRHVFNAAFGVRHHRDLEDIRAWFHVAQGQAFGFRYKDWGDFKSCRIEDQLAPADQIIGSGDGTTTDFALIKRYLIGAFERERPIQKPVDGTVRVAVDTVEVAAAAFSVDSTTGIVTLNAAPPNGAIITAGYEFDVPVRFATDQLDESLEAYQAGQTEVPLIELRIAP